MARTKQTAKKKQQARQAQQPHDGGQADSGGEQQAEGRKFMLAGRNGQVREVFADGTLGPIEKRQKGPRGVPPSVAAGKYKQCSGDELLQKIEHFRAEIQLVEGKRTYRDEAKKHNPIALPRSEKIKLRAARHELQELQRELKARSAAEGEQVAPGEEVASSAAGADAVSGSSDGEEDDDDNEDVDA